MEEEILKRLSDNARRDYLQTGMTKPNAHSDKFIRLVIKGLLKDHGECFSMQEIKYMCMADFGTVAELFPQQAETFTRMLHPDYSLYTYYSGEEENPYSPDSPQGRWWFGECLFNENRLHDEGFVGTFCEMLEDMLEGNERIEPAFLQDESVPIDKRALLYYLLEWNAKWFPYDEPERYEKYVREYINDTFKEMDKREEFERELRDFPELEMETPLFYRSLDYAGSVNYWNHEPHSERFLEIMMRLEDILEHEPEPDDKGLYFPEQDIEYACREDMTTFERFFPDEAEYYRKYLQR